MKTLALVACLSLFGCSSAAQIGFDPSATNDAGPSRLADGGPSTTDAGDASAPVTPDGGPTQGGPTTYKAPCSTLVASAYYADLDLPGKSAAELVRVMAYVPTTPGVPGLAARYPHASAPVMIRDGGVGVFCSATTNSGEATFVVP